MNRQPSRNSVGSQLFLGFVVVLALATVAPPGWAAPSVVTTVAAPTQIPIGTTTAVTVTAQIADAQRLQSVNLYRVNPDGRKTWLSLLNDRGTHGDPTAGDGLFTTVHNFTENVASVVNLQVVVFFVEKGGGKASKQADSPIFHIHAGGILSAGAGGTIQGSGDTSITVQANAIPYDAFVSIEALDPAAIVAPTGSNLPLVGAVEVHVEPVGYVGEVVEPSAPLEISVPAPAGTPDGGRFLVAQQIVFESVAVSSGNIVVGAPTAQLTPVAEATVVGGRIVTQSNPAFGGLRKSGTYAVVGAPGSAFVTGTVREGGVARAGVIVANDTNSLITLTGSTGGYALFVSASAPAGGFSTIAFHPLRGSAGLANGVVSVNGETLTDVDIDLTPLSPVLNVRPGIRNGGFERRNAEGDCELSGWEMNGATEVIPQFGPTAPFPEGQRPGTSATFLDAHPGGTVIRPTEGKCMAAISTASGVGASLAQAFHVPIGATQLTIDYNYISEELPEWVNSQFQDPFRVRVIPAVGSAIEVALVTVNDAFASPGFEVIGDCGFAGGDDTCGQTGWRTVQADLSAFAGTTVTVELLFTVADEGDSIFNTMVLIDNLRFSTVWLDVKILNGASTQEFGDVVARLERDLLHVNEILSQAGVNVRVRGDVPQIVFSPGDLLDVTQKNPHDLNTPGYCTSNGNIVKGADGVDLTNRHLEPEEVDLMNLRRSGTPAGAIGGTDKDVNVYYVRSSSVGGARGWAANPGDFCQEVSIPANVNWGLLVTDSASETTLAHELGHMLITAISNSPGTIMHQCSSIEGTCFTASGAPATAIVTVPQSQAINTSTIPEP